MFYGNSWIFGVIMAIIVAAIILGGIKSIAKVTDKVVPFMVGIYILGALAVIFGNLGEVPGAFGKILSGAFNSDAMYGGLVGVLIQGFKRAAFSNEAGIGSASIAHSAAKTDEPVSEGVVALLDHCRHRGHLHHDGIGHCHFRLRHVRPGWGACQCPSR